MEHNQTHPIFAVDSYAGGLSFGRFRGTTTTADPRDMFYLRSNDGEEVVRARRRYQVRAGEPARELERHLMKLSAKGVLSRSEIFLGVGTDPLHPFDGKFDGTMKLLELFQRYLPGFLHIQTRSPLVVIAMPMLKRLHGRVGITIPIETPLDVVSQKFMPGMPRIDERIKAARTLRNFGIEVTVQVAPLLPYGDWKSDAGKFAAHLAALANYVHILPFNKGTVNDERHLRANPVAQALSRQRLFHWLRPDAAKPLIETLQDLAPEKLMVPERAVFEERQLKIFAA